ncbi:MAG TPA: hypothetical protein VH395_04520 [Jatrophihabitantaceae bacterium]|jgi:hypothetical protein
MRNNKKIVRWGLFAGAACATAALVGFAANGTGAYFSDTHTGSVNASTGHVKVDVTDSTLNFTNLLPGEYQTKTVDYTARGTSGEDIWLVIDPSTATNAYATEAFEGNPTDGHGGGLGRYGHFAVSSTQGAHFASSNLNNPGTGASSGSSCPTDANGWGGSNQTVNSKSDTTLLDFCAPPNAILLASNLTDGQSGTATMTFGYTGLLTNAQDVPLAQVVPFKIVATQHGISPLG